MRQIHEKQVSANANGNETIVYASRKKAVGIFLGSLVFCGFGVMFAFDPSPIKENISEIGILYLAIGVLGLSWCFVDARRTGARRTGKEIAAMAGRIGSIALIVFGTLLIFKPFSIPYVDDIGVTVFILSTFALGVFGAGYNLRCLLFRPVLLIINERGVVNRGVTVQSMGLTLWEDVEIIRVEEHEVPMSDSCTLLVCIVPINEDPVYIGDTNLELSLVEIVKRIEVFHQVANKHLLSPKTVSS